MHRNGITQKTGNRAAGIALAAGLVLAGCMSVSAPPVVLDPEASARMLTERSLDDPDIAAALRQRGLSADSGWTLDMLTVAAWSLRSDIAAAAADVTSGTSAERVAALMPNPTLNLDPSYFVTNFLQDPSPWVIATALSFPIETGGKRDIRVAQAKADTETRRWRLAETLWTARAELRRAMVARALAQRSVALAENELALRQSYLDWVETQIRFGIGIGADRLTAQTNLARAQAQLRTARGEIATAEAALAAAAGIASEELPLARLAPTVIDALPTPETTDPGTLRDWGLVNRLTVRHALADYAVTEEALRLAVARQTPDVTLGAGYTYDRGDHAITLTTGATVPLLHDESDAIAEAVDVRSRAAAQFQAAQAQALGEIDTAAVRYRAAYAALAEARNVEATARNTLGEANRRLNAGAADRGEILTAQLGVVIAEHATLDALRLATDALGSIEDSMQRPVWPVSTLTISRPDTLSTERTP